MVERPGGGFEGDEVQGLEKEITGYKRISNNSEAGFGPT